MRSRFFFLNFSVAFSITRSVSAANPTMILLPFWWPTSVKISGVFFNSRRHIPAVSFFSFSARVRSGALASAYEVWSSFDQRYPQRYVEYVLEELGAVERELTEGTCACGEQEDVLRELRAFDQRFPDGDQHQR